MHLCLLQGTISKLILSLPLHQYGHFSNATQQFSALLCPLPATSPHFPPSVNICSVVKGSIFLRPQVPGTFMDIGAIRMHPRVPLAQIS